ncbi:hypothetical protein BKA69DRAFT_245894 [Paraphysoderma sedebokerense]|nr:hypothetical protein BKA69DRAFT_245894 [Paraphysoderma sedebokerense]
MTSIQSIQRQLQSNIRDLQHYIAKYKSLSEDGYSIANKLVNLDIQKRNVLSSTGLKLDPPKQVAEIKALLDKLEKLFATMVTSISRMKKIQESLETLLFDASNNLGTDVVYSTKIFKSCTFEYLHESNRCYVL